MREAERWLGALRLHRKVEATMQALASAGALDPEPRRGGERRWARQRRADPPSMSLRGRARAPQRLQHVGTVHVQFALREEYGRAFDRELYRPGTFCNELFARLPTAPGPGALSS